MKLPNKLSELIQICIDDMDYYTKSRAYTFNNTKYWYYKLGGENPKIYISFSGILLKNLGYEPIYPQWIDVIGWTDETRFNKLMAVGEFERGMISHSLDFLNVKGKSKVAEEISQIWLGSEANEEKSKNTRNGREWINSPKNFKRYAKKAVEILKQNNL